MIQAELVYKTEAIIGEGSIWDWERKRLLWLDIMNGEIHSFDPASRKDRLILKKPDELIGTVVQRERGGLVAAMRHSICSMDESTGAVEKICELELDKPKNRLNDGKCDAAGRFWVGSLGPDGAGSLYRLGTDHKCDKVLEGISISNGIIWSNDNKTMYYTDTATRVIWAFDYDIETGGISHKRTAVEIKLGEGGPDGFTMDVEGMLWVAQWGGWQVGRYDPKSGKKLDSVKVPAEQVASCAFGGDNLDELYITTATDSLSAEKMRAHPLTGSVFVANVGVQGLKANKFKG